MTDGLRGNKLPLSQGLESDYRPVLSAPQKVDASITHRGFKGARALTMHGVWKGAMKCAFDSDSPTEPHSRNGFFVKFELLWANPPPSSGQAGAVAGQPTGPGPSQAGPKQGCAVCFFGLGACPVLCGLELQVAGLDLTVPANCSFPFLSSFGHSFSEAVMDRSGLSARCLISGRIIPWGPRCHSQSCPHLHLGQ